MAPYLDLFKIEFREFCVTYLVLRQIDDVFSVAGFAKSSPDAVPSGMRRSLVEEYYASADWEEAQTVRRFLKVVEGVLLLSFLPTEAKNELRQLCTDAGFEVDSDGHTVHVTSKGVSHPLKNLIFAADGPKPEIVLSDSVSNEVEIVKNAEYCLVYDRPLKTHGLRWKELVDWWSSRNGTGKASFVEYERGLYRRLASSLASPPEKFLWKTYFERFHDSLTDNLPALIPQVYLHYDPYTIRLLKGKKRFQRQRMDFLLLLSDRNRIVLEVDGKQHYAVGDLASPKLYSEMVAEDRQIKLRGYEVYRFGGFELMEQGSAQKLEDFFFSLFERHEVL